MTTQSGYTPTKEYPECEAHVPIKILKYYRQRQDRYGIHDEVREIEETNWFHAGVTFYPSSFDGPTLSFGLCDEFGYMTQMSYRLDDLGTIEDIQEKHKDDVFYFDAGSVKYKVTCTTISDELSRVWDELKLPHREVTK